MACCVGVGYVIGAARDDVDSRPDQRRVARWWSASVNSRGSAGPVARHVDVALNRAEVARAACAPAAATSGDCDTRRQHYDEHSFVEQSVSHGRK